MEPHERVPQPADVAALPLSERVAAYLEAHRALQERLGLRPT